MRTLPQNYFPLIDEIAATRHAEGLSAWLAECAKRQCDPNEMAETLIAARLPPAASAFLVKLATLGMTFGEAANSDPRVGLKRHSNGTPDNVGFAEKHFIDLGDRTARRIMSMDTMDCALYENFLSDEECEHIKEPSAPLLQRSAVVGKDFSSVETRIRTSAGCFLKRGHSDTVKAIETRIEKLTGMPSTRGENLQVLHYTDAQEYQPHFDFFEPQTEAETEMLRIPGNRVGTLILYLNDVDEGGATYFPQLKLAIHPKKGSALWFGYHGDDGIFDQRSEHAGLPIITGEKWIATKWIRERDFMSGENVERY